jgi:hypothetical protein
MSDNTHIATLTDAELDHVAAGSLKLNIVGIFAAVQTNASIQTSANVGTILSGNQLAVQSNNASVG